VSNYTKTDKICPCQSQEGIYLAQRFSLSFLTSTVDGGEWSASRHGPLPPRTYLIGGFVGPSVGLDVSAKVYFSPS
jgi:hypothetical protein